MLFYKPYTEGENKDSCPVIIKRPWYSYICVAFREPHPEKQPLEENTQN